MEVHVTPELAKKLNELAATTGREPDELVQDALTAYLEELV
jgi:predicted DNA-binding protein